MTANPSAGDVITTAGPSTSRSDTGFAAASPLIGDRVSVTAGESSARSRRSAWSQNCYDDC